MTRLAIEPGRTPVTGSANTHRQAIFDFPAAVFAALETWRRRHKASMQSARIESRVLRDIGISEAQRFIEINKPFWQK